MSLQYPSGTFHSSGTAGSDRGDAASLRRHPLPLSPFAVEGIDISLKDIRDRIDKFSDELGKLSKESMQLGRVSGLLRSIKLLRKQLCETQGAFLLNAASLNPDVYHSQPDLRQLARGRSFDELPSCLHGLVLRLQKFGNCLGEFHERTDEGDKLCTRLLVLIQNVKYRADCIDHYKGRLNTIPLQQYVHQLAHELAVGLHELQPALEAFVTIGVPAIRYEQKRASYKFINMSTVATLFSSVTASTLQMSVATEDASDSMRNVDVLWLCALIFSVGATLNSLLSMAWRQARTGSRAPAIITWWISTSPAIFLALAICSFSAGLIAFAYASRPLHFAAPLTVACTSVTFLGLGAAAFGMLFEGLMFYRHESSLEQAILPLPLDDFDAISVETASTVSKGDPQGDWFDEDLEDRAEEKKKSHSKPTPSLQHLSGSPRLKNLARTVGIEHLVLTKLSKRQASGRSPSISRPIQTFKNAVHAVVAQQSSAIREAKHASSIIIAQRFGRVEYTQFAPDNPYLAVTCVKDGEFGSSSTWTAIYNLQSRPLRIADMWHQGDTVMRGKGLLWSPNGKEILVRFDRELHIWDFHQHISRRLKVQNTIKAVTWFDATTILTAEGYRIYKRSRSHRTMDTYELTGLSIRDMVIESTHNCLVILARVKMKADDRLHVAEHKQEKRVIVYDMDQKQVVYQLPVLEDVLSIQISRFGLRMLLQASQGDFQAWEFDANLDSSNLRVIPILRRLTIVPSGDQPEDGYAGQTTFGGAKDDYIFSLTTSGKIRAWHRVGKMLELHSSFLISLGVEQDGDEAPAIQRLTWRPSSDEFALMHYNTEGSSIIQLWTVFPGGGRPKLPVIRTTASGGSVISGKEPYTGHPLTNSPGLGVRSASSPAGPSFIDIVTRVANLPSTQHSHETQT